MNAPAIPADLPPLAPADILPPSLARRIYVDPVEGHWLPMPAYRTRKGQASRNNHGYTIVRIGGTYLLFHRLTATLYHGPPPRGHVWAHWPWCRRRDCAHPLHGRWATRQANNAEVDMVRRGALARSSSAAPTTIVPRLGHTGYPDRAGLSVPYGCNWLRGKARAQALAEGRSILVLPDQEPSHLLPGGDVSASPRPAPPALAPEQPALRPPGGLHLYPGEEPATDRPPGHALDLHRRGDYGYPSGALAGALSLAEVAG